MTVTPKKLLALDIGSKRIGVAVASSVTRLPQPLTTLSVSEDTSKELEALIKQEVVDAIVIGLPRNLSGEDTDQTKLVRNFGEQLTKKTKLPIYWQDEALTSRQAEAELRQRGVRYNKEHVDALAAVYILEDFLSEQRDVELQ